MKSTLVTLLVGGLLGLASCQSEEKAFDLETSFSHLTHPVCRTTADTRCSREYPSRMLQGASYVGCMERVYMDCVSGKLTDSGDESVATE